MAKLRGVSPEKIEKRLKLLMFGPAGSGKTTAAIQFPRPYLIDTERGAENDQYVRLLAEAGGAYFPTTDFEELVSEITALLSEAHEYRTLIIDPITVVYSDLLDKASTKVGTDFGRHYGEADKRMRHLTNLLTRLDMNVIVTSHAKNLYGPKLEVIGQTFDGWKRLDYLFDLVIELAKRGRERVGIVRKTRIEAFEDGAVIGPWSYEAVSKMYGADLLERVSRPEAIATPDQVADLSRLVATLNIPADQVERWLDKARAESLSEMPASAIVKCIEWCRAKIAAATKTATTTGEE